MTVEVPEGVDWEVMRLVTDERTKVVSPAQLNSEFSFQDGIDLHESLNALNDAQRRAMEKARES